MSVPNKYPVPENEALRLKALDAYNIIDTMAENEYDCITRIAAHICNTPVSLISLLDQNRQWFKSSYGFKIAETPREYSFCNSTIMDGQSILIVPDLRVDKRFSDNPLVKGEPNVVFYAGAPLITPEGYVLGSICVLDDQVRTLDENQIATMMALSQQVVTQLELRLCPYSIARYENAGLEYSGS
ncbi:MAG: GAF domain-containing protein [Chitinophagaceae bacterium]|nr:GAF domain-containing protein [Chitinophagaceae bacterium]